MARSFGVLLFERAQNPPSGRAQTAECLLLKPICQCASNQVFGQPGWWINPPLFPPERSEFIDVHRANRRDFRLNLLSRRTRRLSFPASMCHVSSRRPARSHTDAIDGRLARLSPQRERVSTLSQAGQSGSCCMGQPTRRISESIQSSPRLPRYHFDNECLL